MRNNITHIGKYLTRFLHRLYSEFDEYCAMPVHIGNIIKQAVKKRGIKVTAFANEISCSRRNVYAIFKKPNIDTELLKKIGEKLEENFFLYFISDEDVEKYQQNRNEQKIIENKQRISDHEIQYQTNPTINNELIHIIEDLKQEIDRLKGLK